jgi:hypothetical protein
VTKKGRGRGEGRCESAESGAAEGRTLAVVSLPAIKKFKIVSRSSLSEADSPSGPGSGSRKRGKDGGTFVDVKREKITESGVGFIFGARESLGRSLLFHLRDGVSSLPHDLISEPIDPEEPVEW